MQFIVEPLLLCSFTITLRMVALFTKVFLSFCSSYCHIFLVHFVYLIPPQRATDLFLGVSRFDEALISG